MSEPHPDELEGWGVRWRVTLWGVAGVFVFLAAVISGMYVFWTRAGSPHISTRPAVSFPAPQLNAHLDSDPAWSFAPPNPAEHGPDPDVRRAMGELASRGDAGFAPLAAPPPGLPPQTIGTPTEAGAAAAQTNAPAQTNAATAATSAPAP